jgi:hypothetical protein
MEGDDPMTGIAARKQARRFFGTMGAAMRRTSRWMEARRDARADAVVRRGHGLMTVKFDARVWRGS